MLALSGPGSPRIRPSPDEDFEKPRYRLVKEGVFVTPKKRGPCPDCGLGLGMEGENSFEFSTWRNHSHVFQAPRDINLVHGLKEGSRRGGRNKLGPRDPGIKPNQGVLHE